MAVSRVSDTFQIQSHKGTYSVFFDDRLLDDVRRLDDGAAHFLVDASVARLFADRLGHVLQNPKTIVVDAVERNKSIERVIPVIERLVAGQIRRNHTLVAIGGGIIQDITCFIASTLLRGIPWKFVPTTLLAQADSCIGSKSSINLGDAKNILGTFNPPREVFVCTAFLDTLADAELRSGIGEILKVHAIESIEAFDRVAADYDGLRTDRRMLLAYIRAALEIKKRFIEVDEFDRGVRNVFNYGHSFGHAIESATDFAVPHGIAVSMGMDMANRIAVLRGVLPERHQQRMRGTLRKNYASFAATRIPADALLAALMKDKKNTSSKLVLILATGEEARVERIEVAPDPLFRSHCEKFLEEMRA
jgi:3-dehydroquinate synthase